MKPISLALKGLHSFREKQVVDFVRLCEGGVFGIFGPTGSGKSTLLDAVTLALYGKVERAANNTNGIMNHAENELFVSFCFELGEGERRERYWVERSFRRSGEQGVHTDACRMWKETGQGEEILADKAGDINKKVEELLGLSYEDFTRAVVLPQGKFSKFLTLKGAERRKMLQRIFNLERFGDALREKLDRRERETKSELQAVEAEQAGLGDASAEALRAAEEKVKDAEEQLAQAQRLFAQLEQELKQARQVWDWQQQRHVLQEKWRVLSEKDAEVGRLAVALARAEEAQRLLPYAKALLSARGAVQDGQLRWNEAKKVLQQAETQKTAAETAYQAARARRSAEEPALFSRQQQLNQGRQLAARLAQLDRELADLVRRQKALDRERTEAIRQQQQLAQQRQQLEEEQKRRNEQFLERIVPAETRHQILLAYEAKRDIDRWLQRLREERDELEKKRQEWNHWQQQAEDAERQCRQLQQAAADQLRGLQEQLMRASTAQERLHFLLAELETQRDRQQAALDAAKMNHLAHDLAKQLQDGRPCPVCGATEHPAPAAHVADGAIEQLQQRLEQLQRWIREAEKVQRKIPNMVWAYRQMVDQLSDALGVFLEADSVQETAAARQSVTWSVQVGEPAFQEIQALQALTMQLEQRLLSDKKNVDATVQQLKKAAGNRDGARISFQNVNAVYRGLAEKVAGLEQRLEALRRSWQEAYPHYTLEDIENQYGRLQKLDREAERLRQEIEKDGRTLAQLSNLLESLRQKERELSLQWAALDAQIREKRRGQETMQQELANIIGDQDPDALWQQVQQQLQQLQAQEQEALRCRDMAAEQYQKAVRQMAAAEQLVREARHRLQQAESEWQSQVQRLQETKASSGWTDLFQPEGVQSALLHPAEMERYKKVIQSHEDEKKQIVARLEELEKNLDGKSLSQEAWDSLNLRHKEAQEAVGHWLQARGAAVEAWKTLQDKHRRFMELERKKKELKSLHEKYAHLQQLFRGNAFVEFMAEEHLIRISRDASQRLKSLTRGRYALEIDSGGGFLIRDDANGGVKRPVSSLSGGETFLTSLALALSLSASVQLRGRHPLEFFFLDEGFGSLDQELLDTVVTALERLQGTHMAIGVISHVPELQARLPRRLMVEPAEPGGRGSRVRLEVM